MAAVILLTTLGLTGAVGCTPTRPGPSPTTAPTGTPTPDPADAGLSSPVADPLYPQHGNAALDVLRYQLALAWAPTTRELSGTATLTIRAVTAVDELALDFSPVYTVSSSTVNGVTASASRRGDDLVVAGHADAGARVTLVVAYHGTPKPVPMPSGRGDFPEGLGLRDATGGEAWTMQEPYGAFTWYPANDQPSDEAIYDIAVTVPKGWTAVAQGGLAAVASGATGDTYTWRSDAPVATYLATLALGRYTKLIDTGPHGLPLTYWIRTGRDEAFVPALRDTPQLLEWLEKKFGQYPFATAGVVLVDSESAMETQQMVTFGAKLARGDSSPANTNVVREILLHELSHQWFGDAVTPKDWTGMWLNEGWAMYAEWMWSVEQGWSTNAGWIENARETDASTRPVAGPPGHPKVDHFGESNVYLGPALLLHLIHQSLGDTAFFGLARDWVQTHRNQQVDRAEFIAFVNAHSGKDFTTLITSWLDSPTTPK